MNDIDDKEYKNKYFKYKSKYLDYKNFRNILEGGTELELDIDNIESYQEFVTAYQNNEDSFPKQLSDHFANKTDKELEDFTENLRKLENKDSNKYMWQANQSLKFVNNFPSDKFKQSLIKKEKYKRRQKQKKQAAEEAAAEEATKAAEAETKKKHKKKQKLKEYKKQQQKKKQQKQQKQQNTVLY